MNADSRKNVLCIQREHIWFSPCQLEYRICVFSVISFFFRFFFAFILMRFCFWVVFCIKNKIFGIAEKKFFICYTNLLTQLFNLYLHSCWIGICFSNSIHIASHKICALNKKIKKKYGESDTKNIFLQNNKYWFLFSYFQNNVRFIYVRLTHSSHNWYGIWRKSKQKKIIHSYHIRLSKSG